MYSYNYNPNTGYWELLYQNKLYQFVTEYEAIEFIQMINN